MRTHGHPQGASFRLAAEGHARATLVIDEEKGEYYISQAPWVAHIGGPTPWEERERREAWKAALDEARVAGYMLLDPEIIPEEEQPDGTVRWHLGPVGPPSTRPDKEE